MIGDIVLHNIQYGTQIANFSQKGSQGVKQVKFSPFKKNLLASAGVDGTVCVWDINSRQTIANFASAHTSRVNALAFSTSNPALLCSASLDQKINFYDINEKKLFKSMQTDSPLTALGFHNDGHTIVVGTLYGGLNVYDLRAYANVKISLKGHENSQINFIDFIKPEGPRASVFEEEKENKVNTSNLDSKPPLDLSTQRKSLAELAQKNSMPDGSLSSITQRSTTPTRGENIGEKGSSLLDPNNEIKGKFLNIEQIKKQAYERIDVRKNEKLAEKTSFDNKPRGLNTSLGNIDSARKILETEPSTTIMNDTRKNSTEAMVIESSGQMGHPQSNNHPKNFTERFDEKTGFYMNKIDNSSKDFTEPQKEFLRECFFDLRNTVSEGIENLHLEIIRQFEIQQNEIEMKLDKYFTQFNYLFKQYEETRIENERLKKTSF